MANSLLVAKMMSFKLSASARYRRSLAWTDWFASICSVTSRAMPTSRVTRPNSSRAMACSVMANQRQLPSRCRQRSCERCT